MDLYNESNKCCCICLYDELNTIKCSRCSCFVCTTCNEKIKICPQCRLINPNKLTNINIVFVDETRKKEVELTKEIYDLIKMKANDDLFKLVEELILKHVNSYYYL